VAIQPLLFAKPEIECAAAAKPGVSKWDHVWWNAKGAIYAKLSLIHI
jgi:hypothetical protein